MHLPPFFFETVALIFLLAGGLCAWFTRWHVLIAALAACAALLVLQVLHHLLMSDAVSLFEEQGPLVFYAMICGLGFVPAALGSWLVRFYKRWRAQ